MLFNSYKFIFAFLPLSVAVYFVVNKYKYFRTAKIFLIIISFLFCAYSDISSMFVIIASIVFNYILGRVLISENKFPVSRKLPLIFALIVNISVLCYFKYTNFFISNFNSLFDKNVSFLKIALPLGISFYTFQQISYIVDCYRREVPKYSFIDYALYVSFFPKLSAGPIAFQGEMIPQFSEIGKKKFSYANVSNGLMMFAVGLAKKVLIADSLSNIASYGFDSVSSLSCPEAWIVSLAYTFQLYFDFSGYSDMALGIGKMFNIDIPLNFNSPYKSLNIRDFWARWHITLTRFLTKYLYFPLGGSRKGYARTLVNIMIVFLVSGFWHGAGWTFIFWGLLHGLASVIYRIFGKKLDKLPAVLNWFITFNFINIAWVFFRSSNFQKAASILRSMFSFKAGTISKTILNDFLIVDIENVTDTTLYIIMFAVIAFLFFIVLGTKNTFELSKKFKPNALTSVCTAVLLVLSILFLSQVKTFLYFNF